MNIQRLQVFWENINSFITYIAERNILNISLFSMDCLAIISLFALNQYFTSTNKNVSLSTDEININNALKWTAENWQDTLLNPYKVIANINVADDINLNVVFCLNKILQNCYSCFSSKGWASFIEISHILIKKDDDVNLFENGKINIIT